MSEKFKTGDPVLVLSGRHAGKLGMVEFYGVSRYDRTQPVVCLSGERIDGKMQWYWVRPEHLKLLTRQEAIAKRWEDIRQDKRERLQ